MSSEPPNSTTSSSSARPGRRWLFLAGLLAAVALVTIAVTALLITIFQHRQEARTPFVRVVEVDEGTSDPIPWSMNWPRQFDTYRRTVDTEQTTYGGSSAMPESKLEQQPWLRRLYAGYAFSLDYREARGHAYMLYDQEVTERVTQRAQPGACLHCHASVLPMYRRLGLEAMNQPAGADVLAADFNWPAVLRGFELASAMSYAMLAQLCSRRPMAPPASMCRFSPAARQPMRRRRRTSRPRRRPARTAMRSRRTRAKPIR